MGKTATVELTAKQEKATQHVVEAFRDGSVAGKIALACFPNPNILSDNWTLRNRILGFLTTGCRTMDVRSVAQWRRVGRRLKKGAVGGYILKPLKRSFFVDVKDEATGKMKKERRSYIYGFKAITKFCADDTEGAPLDYEKDHHLPDNLPLLAVAEKWGIKVNATWICGGARGSYAIDGSEIQIGVEAQHAPKVFFHELAHASHARLMKKWGKKMTGGQDPLQEITAELSAEILRRVLDPEGEIYPDTSGNSLEYVQIYARAGGMDLNAALVKVLGEVSQVVNLILTEAADL